MKHARTRSDVLAACLAGVGLLAGHAVEYGLLDEPARAHVLRHTAHGWLGVALLPAIVGAGVALLVLGASVIANGRRASTPATATQVFVRLAFLQASGFAIIEVLERAASGSIAHHLSFGFLAAGVAVQVLVAAIVAMVVATAERAIETLTRGATRRPRRSLALPSRARVIVAPPSRIAWAPAAARAPPIG